MKQVILIKQAQSIQLAHLYEHIFCSQIDKIFYQNHLFPRLDYDLTGRTFYRGIVYIELNLYTTEAVSLAKQVSALKMDFNEVTLSTAASQLLAEKEQLLDGSGYEEVKQALEELDRKTWENLDDVDLIDTKGFRAQAYPLYLVEGKSLPARKLRTSVMLDTDFAISHRELLPLFRQIAWLITATLQSVLADEYGYYSFDDQHANSSRSAGLTNIFKVADGHDVDLSDNLKAAMQAIDYLQTHDAFGRLAVELGKTSHYPNSDLAPNPEASYKDTHILIGSKGWKRIATKENCDLLLRHTSLELQFGRERIASPLRG